MIIRNSTQGSCSQDNLQKSLDKYLSRAYYVPGTVVSKGENNKVLFLCKRMYNLARKGQAHKP
jgi:hypothetical protein